MLENEEDILLNKKNFADWLNVKSRSQNPLYKSHAVNLLDYILAEKFPDLNLGCLFAYNDPDEYAEIKNAIVSHADFAEVNEKDSSGRPTAALNKYKEFLDDLSSGCLDDILAGAPLQETTAVPIRRTSMAREVEILHDAYMEMCEYFEIPRERFYEWGLSSIIYPSKESVREEWNALKNRVFGNEDVFIRSHGRNGSGSKAFVTLNSILFNNHNVHVDSTNNAKPQELIQLTTGLRKNKEIINYQISHIFGQTKNTLLFTAPWNICFTPKMIDPLTGHETKGKFPEEFQRLFHAQVFERYGEFIADFNSLMLEYCSEEKINAALRVMEGEYSTATIKGLRKAAKSEFGIITL